MTTGKTIALTRQTFADKVMSLLFTSLLFTAICNAFPDSHFDAGRDWGQEEKGTTEDEMAGWHHQLDGREFE